MMPPNVRKLALTLHVAATVGWVGALAAFLALAVTGLLTDDRDLARGCYLAMDVVTRVVILPLAFASLGSGLASALGSSWGLVRHRWVLAKLVLTSVALGVLLKETPLVLELGRAALADTWWQDAFLDARRGMVLHAAGGMAFLLANLVLSVFKPKGLTRWGRKAEMAQARR